MNQIDLLNEARQEEDLPSPCFDDFNHKIKYDDEYYARYIHHFKPNPGKRLAYRFIKRSFDVILALLLLVFLLPLFAVIAIAIKCDSKGPVLFIQKRVGKNGKVFNCYKFRSMSVDAPSECATSQLKNPHLYLTRVGRFLRRFSLDELPQIWCVLIGTMSFVGYRPLILSEKNCNDMRAMLSVFSMRPGITGLAQVSGRDDVYYKNKAILDAQYVKKASVLMDLKILFSTVIVVLGRKGNHS